MTSLCEHDHETLAGELRQLGHNPAHARTLLRALYGDGGRLKLESLPVTRALRHELAAPGRVMRSEVIARQTARDGTVKLLLQFPDGATCEAVLMPAQHRADRAAGCVSTQVGCAMGCDFCASTKNGLTRNLSAGEIVEQFLHLRHEATLLGRRLASLVLMGMGEPMHNLDNVIPALRRIADPLLGAIGWRHVTVSTVGVVPGIQRLAAEGHGVHLALSLHAPDDETRQKLVPAGRRYLVAEIMSAARAYQVSSGRITTIEYCLLAGVNDSDAQAIALARLIADWRAHVNVIPYNAIGAGISGTTYHRPDESRIRRFIELLREQRVVTHIRAPRGNDVDAACGQLREQLQTVQIHRSGAEFATRP